MRAESGIGRPEENIREKKRKTIKHKRMARHQGKAKQNSKMRKNNLKDISETKS